MTDLEKELVEALGCITKCWRQGASGMYIMFTAVQDADLGRAAVALQHAHEAAKLDATGQEWLAKRG